MQQYLEGKSIEEIIGEKNKQTPSKRYQVQMFLQDLLEYDSATFVEAGEKILESDDIRYYVKFVFYEILGQIAQPDENIKEFVREACKHDAYSDYLLNNVIYGNHRYVTILREFGILQKWFEDEKRKNNVFVLLRSIGKDLNEEDIAFIKEYSFKNEEDDRNFVNCFSHDITQEKDEVFELRMLFYYRYPELAQELYIDIKSMMKNCEVRTIRLISFWLKNKIKSKGRTIYHYEEELIYESNLFLIENGGYVLDELLQYIPKGNSWEIQYSDWSGTDVYKHSIERATVELIKKANKAVINQNPELFWSYYEPYMGKNYTIFNEIILHGLRFLPSSYSNRVISYLSNDLDKNIFDYTSGADEQLEMAIEVLKVHTALCEVTYLRTFENAIERYVSPSAVEWYKDRIEYNKDKEYAPVYWSFWGDMQYQLLRSIPYERLSCESRNLLKVLERKFEGKSYRYINRSGHSGTLASPVSGKKIGRSQWFQIMTNEKLKNRKHAKWKEVEGGFIESSLEMYSSDFSSAVGAEPESMIQLVLENKDDIIPIYIDAMYSGAAFSEHIEKISQQTWEEMFRVFPCDMESHRASYFCTILEKAKIYTWSTEVLSQLKDIAINFKGDIRKGDSEETVIMDCNKLVNKALNCVRGKAARAIGNLLWESKELFAEFKDVIDKLTLDDNLVVNMASFYALWPSYNIDREWAETRILHLYESDVRLVGFQDSRNMFFLLYPKYKERVLTIIRESFESQDKNLIEIGGYSLCEFYIRYSEFEEIISVVETLNEEQVKAILHMAVIYLQYEEERDKAKGIILKCKNLESDIEFSISRIFYDKLVDAERDSEFLLEIMKSKISKRIVYSFVYFLEENACSIRDYAEIVLVLCESVLGMNSEAIAKQYGIEDNISKLIIGLYDECANSEKKADKLIAERCLEVWDIMFEKQIGHVRALSRELMER